MRAQVDGSTGWGGRGVASNLQREEEILRLFYGRHLARATVTCSCRHYSVYCWGTAVCIGSRTSRCMCTHYQVHVYTLQCAEAALEGACGAPWGWMEGWGAG